MPQAEYEKIESQRVKDWAYQMYLENEVLYTGDRKSDGYPTVAEIKVSTVDVDMFPELQKATAIIIYHWDFTNHRIDNEAIKYPINDLVFEVQRVN